MINTKSRNLSYQTGPAYPVRVHDYKRRWNRLEGPNEPYMGIIPCLSHTVNGVVFKVDDAMIAAFDDRELKWGYNRNTIPVSKIEILTDDIHLDEGMDIVEAYELQCLHAQDIQKMDIESAEYRRLRKNGQRYIDVCMTGCREYGDEFVKEFVRTMYDWRYQWNLDRKTSRRRSWEMTESECQYVDEMLKKYVKEFHSIDLPHLQPKRNMKHFSG